MDCWVAVTRPIGQIKQADPRAIWHIDEVPSDDEDDDAYETRIRPEYVLHIRRSAIAVT